MTDWAGLHCYITQWGMGTELTGSVEIEVEGEFLKGGFWDTVTSYRFVCRYEEGFTMIVEKEPQKIVLEVCHIAGWVVDIARALGKETETANTTHDAWRWINVKRKFTLPSTGDGA